MLTIGTATCAWGHGHGAGGVRAANFHPNWTEEIMRSIRRLLMGVAAGLMAMAGTSPEARADDAAQRARLAESLLSRAESLAGRAFDARFRASALGALTELPLPELEKRLEGEGAKGIGPLAIGDSNAQLVYTPLTPCRIADTRRAGGSIAAGTIREFRVTGGDLSPQGGNLAGCGVPTGPATAAIVNFVAVNPVGAGDLRAWAYSTPPVAPPGASILNYASVVGLNIANGIAVPICNPALSACTYDLRVQADVSSTHLVADVVGYFERFPREQARGFTVVTSPTDFTGLPSVCSHVPGAEVTVNAPVAGRVLVEAHVGLDIQHTGGIEDAVFLWIRPDSATCGSATAGGIRGRVPAGFPSGDTQFTTVGHAVFDVPSGLHTYYLNGVRGGVVPSLVDMMMFATFQPN
jgi:hypothetical protein